jgi:hypothetical protein
MSRCGHGCLTSDESFPRGRRVRPRRVSFVLMGVLVVRRVARAATMTVTGTCFASGQP